MATIGESFTYLNEDEKQYLASHPDPSHMIVYLKQGKSFIYSLKRGYVDSVKDDIELHKSESEALKNVVGNRSL
tara:strand:- start:295 stop:516 length:222 start_codon:yes stop_codon:yes gene_type:complete